MLWTLPNQLTDSILCACECVCVCMYERDRQGRWGWGIDGRQREKK